MKIAIYIGEDVFLADFYENEVSESLKEKFPLTLHTEQTTLNSKDFYAPLDKKIVSLEKPTQTLIPGDISLYNSISISLCVKDSNVDSEYSQYIKIGHINEPYGLEAALIKNNGIVKFDFFNNETEAIA